MSSNTPHSLSGNKKAQVKPATHRVHRRTKPIRFVCPDHITNLKHQLVLDAFQVVFEQFPRKIVELKALKEQKQYQPNREDILTDCRCFGVPPSLRDIQKKQDKKVASNGKGPTEMSCNCNRQSQVYLTYDGYIRANAHLVQFVKKLESYYDFFSNWWSQFYYALLLLKPEMQDENSVQSDVQDMTVEFISDICSRVNNYIDSVDVCHERFSNIVRTQRYPHVSDYRENFTVYERETWFELCLIAHQLHSNFALTYDCVAKNYHKLI